MRKNHIKYQKNRVGDEFGQKLQEYIANMQRTHVRPRQSSMRRGQVGLRFYIRHLWHPIVVCTGLHSSYLFMFSFCRGGRVLRCFEEETGKANQDHLIPMIFWTGNQGKGDKEKEARSAQVCTGLRGLCRTQM